MMPLPVLVPPLLRVYKPLLENEYMVEQRLQGDRVYQCDHGWSHHLYYLHDEDMTGEAGPVV